MNSVFKMIGRQLSCKQCGLICMGAILVGVVLAYYYVGQSYYSFSQINQKYYRTDVLEEKMKLMKGQNGNSIKTQSLTDVKEFDEETYSDEINVIITFTNAHRNFALQDKFKLTVTSMLSLTSSKIALHILGDEKSQDIAKNIVEEHSNHTNCRLVNLNIEEITKKLYDIVKDMQKYFSVKQSYYSDALFFMSIAIHRVLPANVHKVIMMDSDLKFNADILDLHALFSNFSDTNIMGIARDAQPVYRHRFSLYRSQNKGTRVGDPPPGGITGFNSGVLLLDLDRMRKSKVYNSLISADVAKTLTKKYSFTGHLGDQCFFTLLAIEHEELFYYLPCTWNRQLCEWWRGKGYDDVFDLYFRCDGHINIYHGNCNTKIPD